MLNEKINALEEKLGFFINKRIGRDDIVIELLKMLRDNLDSRNQLVAKLNRADNDRALSGDKDYSGDEETDIRLKVSSLERRLQK